MTYESVADLDFSVDELDPLPSPTRVLLTEPTYFDVLYAINAHMHGNIGAVDRELALSQWEALYEAYATLGLAPTHVRGRPGLPDMVFCANQTLPFVRPDGREGVILSRMFASERMDEVSHFAAFFRSIGYETIRLPDEIAAFEGMGDALWHPGRRLLWGGHGQRSDRAVYGWISDLLDTPVMLVHLDDPDFYHLDTCLCLLDHSTAMYCREAFDDAGRRLIEQMFGRLIAVPESEARERFACNAHCPDGETVFIQAGSAKTIDMLRSLGFRVVELDTSEYLKAGGSVFCMKQMYW